MTRRSPTSKLAKYILAIPASSATYERIFSAGGLTVNNKRTLLNDDKVEDILKIRLNILKLEKAKAKLGTTKVPWYAESNKAPAI